MDGIVKSAKPLLYNGILIEELSLTFDEVAWSIFPPDERGDARHLLDTDEGSRHIGEVALVPYHSPINDMGILFYNTLFDENASCHLALGEAYAMTIGGEERSEEALAQKGLNTSMEPRGLHDRRSGHRHRRHHRRRRACRGVPEGDFVF